MSLIPGGYEWIIIGIISLLIFGRRLPEVARALGNSIVQFKKGIADVQTDIDDASTTTKNPLEAALPENRVKPLQPYDERLGGDQEELEKLQQGQAVAQDSGAQAAEGTA